MEGHTEATASRDRLPCTCPACADHQGSSDPRPLRRRFAPAVRPLSLTK